MLRINTHGTVRIVILCFGLAFKVPYPFARKGRNGGLRDGRMSNLEELKLWKRTGSTEIGGVSLCPIKFSLPFGLLIVMPEAKPFTWDEWKAMDFRDRYDNFTQPATALGVDDTIKPDTFGRLNGKIVVLDYGWWVSEEAIAEMKRQRAEFLNGWKNQ